jgi:hypothetical protein
VGKRVEKFSKPIGTHQSGSTGITSSPKSYVMVGRDRPADYEENYDQDSQFHSGPLPSVCGKAELSAKTVVFSGIGRGEKRAGSSTAALLMNSPMPQVKKNPRSWALYSKLGDRGVLEKWRRGVQHPS